MRISRRVSAVGAQLAEDEFKNRQRYEITTAVPLTVTISMLPFEPIVS